MTINFKTCPNCSSVFRVDHGLRKFCNPNCCRRYWDKQHPEYYRQYYNDNREGILQYYRKRKKKYRKLRHNIYKDKREIPTY